jgi:hypothetical protein
MSLYITYVNAPQNQEKFTSTYHGLKTQTPNENLKKDGFKTSCESCLVRQGTWWLLGK